LEAWSVTTIIVVTTTTTIIIIIVIIIIMRMETDTAGVWGRVFYFFFVNIHTADHPRAFHWIFMTASQLYCNFSVVATLAEHIWRIQFIHTVRNCRSIRAFIFLFPREIGWAVMAWSV
jgi:hypothetical protein